jgi:hypothetical protein
MANEPACVICGDPSAEVPAALRLPHGSASAVEFLAQYRVIDDDVFRELNGDVDRRRVCKSCSNVLTDCAAWSDKLEAALECLRRDLLDRQAEHEIKPDIKVETDVERETTEEEQVKK